jgi:sugar transferase (PEP-CTERM/EpsH1 system associated)
VSLVHDREEAAQADTLRQLGVAVSTALVPRTRNLAIAAIKLPTSTPLTHLLLDSPGMRPALDRTIEGWQPDVVLAYCSGVAPLSLMPPLAGIPFVLDMVDVDSAKWATFAGAARFPRSWIYSREARCLSAFEARAVRAAFAVTVVNERERDTLLRLCPGAAVHVSPNGVDVEALSPTQPPSAEDRVIFSAVFDYAPNADGAVWFAQHVWPRVKAARPSARLTLAGSSPTGAVRRLAEDASIEVTGRVGDMRPYLWRSAVAVAPIFQSRGVQNKVLEAAAAGLPSVVTRAVGDGLPQQVLAACRITDTADAFAAAVIELLSLTPGDRRRLTARAALSSLGWQTRLAPLVALIERAAAAHTDIVGAV